MQESLDSEYCGQKFSEKPNEKRKLAQSGRYFSCSRAVKKLLEKTEEPVIIVLIVSYFL